MSGHEDWRETIVDEALGLLSAERREAVRRHLEDCADCRQEHAGVRRALEAAGHDAAAVAEPPIDAAALASRVWAEVDRRRVGGTAVRRLGRFWLPAAAAAALAVVALRWGARETTAPAELTVSAEALVQMERTVNREQTARYLEDAQGVLLSVTTTLPHCERSPERREVGTEARRSRDLLARRRLLVDADSEHLASARPLLDDVDHLLGEVATLDPCTRPDHVQAIARRLAEEHLLMKMELVARELMG